MEDEALADVLHSDHIPEKVLIIPSRGTCDSMTSYDSSEGFKEKDNGSGGRASPCMTPSLTLGDGDVLTL